MHINLLLNTRLFSLSVMIKKRRPYTIITHKKRIISMFRKYNIFSHSSFHGISSIPKHFTFSLSILRNSIDFRELSRCSQRITYRPHPRVTKTLHELIALPSLWLYTIPLHFNIHQDKKGKILHSLRA